MVFFHPSLHALFRAVMSFLLVMLYAQSHDLRLLMKQVSLEAFAVTSSHNVFLILSMVKGKHLFTDS